MFYVSITNEQDKNVNQIELKLNQNDYKYYVGISAITIQKKSTLCDDSDGDGVIDQWDECPDTPRSNLYVDKHGCSPISNSSPLSGLVIMKGKPLNNGKAILIQSGEIHQNCIINDKGAFEFNSVAEDKPFSVFIRKE